VRVVVIGVGNDYRGDDAAGLEVARRVQASAPAGVKVVERDGEAAGLIDAWDGADLAVVVDAVHSHTAEPGHVHRVEVDGAHGPPPPRAVSSHDSGPGDAVALARALKRLPARLVLYGIEGAAFSPGVGLSPQVEGSVAHVAARVMDETEKAVG
jgi:hydrogenase maturation protease